eukprot:3397243-Amphidinium_carterae.1
MASSAGGVQPLVPTGDAGIIFSMSPDGSPVCHFNILDDEWLHFMGHNDCANDNVGASYIESMDTGMSRDLSIHLLDHRSKHWPACKPLKAGAEAERIPVPRYPLAAPKGEGRYEGHESEVDSEGRMLVETPKPPLTSPDARN